MTSAGFLTTISLPTSLQLSAQTSSESFLFSGNHEFYGTSRSKGLELAAQLEKEPRFKERLRILNRTRIELANNVTILGCTLQSFITPECEQIVQSKIQDFRRIVDWTIADHNTEHEIDVKWLRANIEQIRTNASHDTHRIVVVTHHAPARRGSSRPEHERNPWTDAFATELLAEDENHDANPLHAVNHWIFGHTHFSTEFCRGQVRITSNQRGYVLGQDRGQKETETSMEEKSESQSKVVPFKKLLDLILVRRKPNTRQQALDTQTALTSPCQTRFDVRKCIEI